MACEYACSFNHLTSLFHGSFDKAESLLSTHITGSIINCLLKLGGLLVQIRDPVTVKLVDVFTEREGQVAKSLLCDGGRVFHQHRG